MALKVFQGFAGAPIIGQYSDQGLKRLYRVRILGERSLVGVEGSVRRALRLQNLSELVLCQWVVLIEFHQTTRLPLGGGNVPLHQ